MVYYEESGIIELLTTYGKTIFSKVTKSMFEELFFCYRKLSLYLKGIRYDFVVVKSNFRGDLVSHIWEKTPKLSVILYNSLNSVSAKKSQSDFMPARASPSGFAAPYHFSISPTCGFAFGDA